MHDELLPASRSCSACQRTRHCSRSSMPRRRSASAGQPSPPGEGHATSPGGTTRSQPEDELWLFVDTVTGLPVKPETAQRALAPRPRLGRGERPRQRLAPHDRLPQPPPPRRDQVVPRGARRALGGRCPIPRRQAHHRPEPLRPRRRGRAPRLRQQALEPVARQVMAANWQRGRDSAVRSILSSSLDRQRSGQGAAFRPTMTRPADARICRCEVARQSATGPRLTHLHSARFSGRRLRTSRLPGACQRRRRADRPLPRARRH